MLSLKLRSLTALGWLDGNCIVVDCSSQAAESN
jgi:hypothetical protein